MARVYEERRDDCPAQDDNRYRAAVWVGPDEQSELVLTLREDADRSDDALLALGVDAYREQMDSDDWCQPDGTTGWGGAILICMWQD